MQSILYGDMFLIEHTQPTQNQTLTQPTVHQKFETGKTVKRKI